MHPAAPGHEFARGVGSPDCSLSGLVLPLVARLHQFTFTTQAEDNRSRCLSADTGSRTWFSPRYHPQICQRADCAEKDAHAPLTASRRRTLERDMPNAQQRLLPVRRMWREGDGPRPDWIEPHLVGRASPNGAFLIQTPLGRQRVHRGHIVIEDGTAAYSCAPDELATKLLAITATDRSRSPALIVGPGKKPVTGLKTGPGRKRSYGRPLGVPPTIEWVAVDCLLIDPDYQRSIESSSSRRLIASIAARWDWRLCMPLAVSRRAAGKFVIDGQHRLAAAKLRGDLPHLPCCVAEYESLADEAGMFVAANRARRAISRLDDFHAALVAGDEDAIEVDRMIKAAGLRVARMTGKGCWVPGEVSFTSSVASSIIRHGSGPASNALAILSTSFADQVLTNGASIFVALCILQSKFSPEHLQACIERRSMEDWGLVVHGVSGTDGRAKAIAAAVEEESRILLETVH